MSFYRELFDPKNILKIEAVTSSYPHKNNCYRVILLKKDTNPITIEYAPKHQVDLAMHLKVTSSRLDKAAIDLLEKMWNEAYETGTTDCEMSNAGADL